MARWFCKFCNLLRNAKEKKQKRDTWKEDEEDPEEDPEPVGFFAVFFLVNVFNLFPTDANRWEVAIITGATSGVGLEAARILAANGCEAWAFWALEFTETRSTEDEKNIPIDVQTMCKWLSYIVTVNTDLEALAVLEVNLTNAPSGCVRDGPYAAESEGCCGGRRNHGHQTGEKINEKCTKTSAKETSEPICGNLMKKLFSLQPFCSLSFDLLTCWLQVFPLELNLASLTSVRNFVAEWKSSIRREGETSDVNFVNFEQVVNKVVTGSRWISWPAMPA